MYYYGARYYDPRLSIFISVDPLAEKYPDYTPYHYTLNNPINFVDPDGRDVYRRDGDKFIFVRLNNENEGKKDHVGVFIKNKDGEFVQDMDSNGNLKYEAKDIAKGIFSKYQSFTGSDKYFDVNGNHSDGSAQLTENDILDFAVKLQSMVKKEISGYALSDKPAGGEITGMIIEPYKTRDYENTEVTSYSKQFKAMTAIPRPVADLIDQKVFPFYHFHTHPDTSSPSRDDMEAAKRSSVLDMQIKITV